MATNDLWVHPIVVAPMGGGPTTPALVGAAANAGALGFLAGGYVSPAALAEQIAAVQALTTRGFGVNLFVPGTPAPPEVVDRYVRSLEPEAEALGATVAPAAWDDDAWDAKLEVLLDTAPAAVSFTFRAPPPAIARELQQRGTTVIATVTSPDEARECAAAGVEMLCCQGIEAGAHRGCFDGSADPNSGLTTLALIDAVHQVTELPIIAAGGLGRPSDVAAALRAGAVAVQAGTAFLRSHESGAHAVYKAALTDARFDATGFTRSFSGRPARGLVNRFMRDHPDAPTAYPEINNATRPLRAAAAQRSDPNAMSLWAGTGYRHTREASAGEIVEWLASEIG